MSDYLKASSPHPLLKLTQCPRCDYSLEGLPEAGVCPECGEPYGQEFVVLRGKPIAQGDNPNGHHIPSPLNMTIVFVLLLGLVVGLRWENSWTLSMLAVVAVPVAINAILWFSQNRRGTALIWMGRQGIAQQRLLERGSPAGQLHNLAAHCSKVAFPTVLLFVMAFGFRQEMRLDRDTILPNSPTICGLLFAAPTLVLALLIYLGQLRRVSYPGSGIRPGLLRWTAYQAIEIQPLGDGDYEFRTMRSPSTRRSEVINIQIKASAAAIRELCELIAEWSEHRRVPVMKPQIAAHGAKAARSAGLAVRRMFGRNQNRQRRGHLR